MSPHWNTKPPKDDNEYFERMTKSLFTAGLNWSVVDKKWPNFHKAFSDFSLVKVSKFSEKDVKTLLNNAGIVRNEKKIRATVYNAGEFLRLQKEFGSFDKYIWSFIDGKPIVNRWKVTSQVPATSKESDEISKDLKKRGFNFVGSTIIYAHMQATGMVNDHLVSCFRFKECS